MLLTSSALLCSFRTSQMKALLTICLLFVCFGGITGIPRGGNMIASHCKDLHPAHAGTTPQTGQAPYNITTSIDLSTGYIPNTQYTGRNV